jgi:hypothetical protein
MLTFIGEISQRINKVQPDYAMSLHSILKRHAENKLLPTDIRFRHHLNGAMCIATYNILVVVKQFRERQDDLKCDDCLSTDSVT